MSDEMSTEELIAGLERGDAVGGMIIDRLRELERKFTKDQAAVGFDGDEAVMGAAKIIYQIVFEPGEEIDGHIMPPFEAARKQEIGAYQRVMEAACAVLRTPLPGR